MMIAIAIDGPGGAGKSTMARAVAKQLGYIYVDTGALYRAIGLYMRRHDVPTTDPRAVAANLGEVQVRLAFRGGEQRVFLCGADVSDEIRTQDISIAASNVSAVPRVRDFLFDLQRDLARENNVVMDGRDIGTVVLPDAQVKIFLTASPEERAQRRYRELLEKGVQAEYQQVLTELKQRDYDDSHRTVAPLVPAEDAIRVDSTGLTREQALQRLLKTIQSKISADNSGIFRGTAGSL